MSARPTTTPTVYECAEVNCICINPVVQAGRRVITPNVLMRKGTEEIRLCLLCYFGYRTGWQTRGFSKVEVFKNPVG